MDRGSLGAQASRLHVRRDVDHRFAAVPPRSQQPGTRLGAAMEIGSQNYFTYLTAATYWSLILCWSIILGFYVREYRRVRSLSPMIATLLVVIFIDGARTLVESIYFGTAYTARTQLLPARLWPVLMEGEYVIFPKALNLIAALIIMAVMVRHWFADLETELERKQKVDQLYTELQRAYGELKQLQQAREDMTQMLVHDMRTPLTNVITSLHTIQQAAGASEEGAGRQGPPLAGGEATGTAGGDAATVDHALAREMVDAALGGAQRVMRMVNDLLDISRMEAGELMPDWRELPVEEAMREAVASVQALADEKGIILRAEPVPERLAARADPELVRRVLVNILGNAVKFTPPGGSVTAAAAPEGDQIRFSITDTGPGIGRANRERIFEKFYQAESGEHRAASPRVASTGLGLTFCRLAIAAHGGEIGVESEPGHGSTFWFTLPAAGAPVSSNTLGRAPEPVNEAG